MNFHLDEIKYQRKSTTFTRNGHENFQQKSEACVFYESIYNF